MLVKGTHWWCISFADKFRHFNTNFHVQFGSKFLWNVKMQIMSYRILSILWSNHEPPTIHVWYMIYFVYIYSRMRSEGFPFIVGVWGWTCVRFVFLVSSSPRRRVVVASSSPTRRQLVNFSPLGGTFALQHTSYFQSMKSGGSLARNALFGGVKSQNGRSFSCFAWQAQYFGSVSMQARCFFVAGAALCDVTFRDVVAGAAFCDVAKVLFPRIAMAVTWQSQWRRCCLHYCKYRGRRRIWWLSWKVAEASQKSYFLSSVKMAFLEKTRTKSSIFELKVWNLKEVSHEMLVLTLQTFKVRGHFRVLRGRRKTLEAPWLKSWGSLVRNARFGSLFLEKLRKSRTKCSFWKLFAWKVAEVSHEMLVLEACRLKSCGSLARNARFGSFSLEKLRKSRTKCSFWKLVAWKVAEVSHEMLVLEAFVLLCSTE